MIQKNIFRAIVAGICAGFVVTSCKTTSPPSEVPSVDGGGCFAFQGESPTKVGPFVLPAPATRICVQKVGGFRKPDYYDITLKDADESSVLLSLTRYNEVRDRSFEVPEISSKVWYTNKPDDPGRKKDDENFAAKVIFDFNSQTKIGTVKFKAGLSAVETTHKIAKIVQE